MDYVRIDGLQAFADLRDELSFVEIIPGSMTNVIRGQHERHGDVILIADGDGAFMFSDGVRFIAPGDEIDAA